MVRALILYYRSIGTVPALLNRVISQVDYTVELSLLFMIISMYYIYIASIDNYHI